LVVAPSSPLPVSAAPPHRRTCKQLEPLLRGDIMWGDGCYEEVAACSQPPESSMDATAAGGGTANLVRCCKGVCGLLPTAAGSATHGG
jgi:hypothetical protein